MRTILLIALIGLSGCAASRCIKEPTVLKQKQCQWDARHDRNIKMFVSGTLVSMTGWIYGALGGWGIGAPVLFGGWCWAAIGAIDDEFVMPNYPKEKGGLK